MSRLPLPARPDVPPPDDGSRPGLARLVVLSALAGAAIGVVGGSFRRLIVVLGQVRGELAGWVAGQPLWRGPLVVLVGAVAVAAGTWVVRLAPEAAGSGVQRIESVLRGGDSPPRLRVLPVKFVGGLLALGSGMLLGREGPTVHMGSALGSFAARRGGVDGYDERTLTAALGGAGLGVAFGAPLAGILFAVEEVAHAFRTRLVVAAVVSSCAGYVLSVPILGSRPQLAVDVGTQPLGYLALDVLLGLGLGALAVPYNWLVLRLLDRLGSLRTVPELPAALVGALIAGLTLVAPLAVGEGDDVVLQVLGGQLSVGVMLAVALARWLLGPLCYAVGTPGGLFAPLLALGSIGGALVATTAAAAGLGVQAPAFEVIGMTAFFAGVVRAPLTGVAVVLEMTGANGLLLPALVASVCASVAADLLGGTPIYDALRERMKPPIPAGGQVSSAAGR